MLGSGTEQDPYQVATATDLDAVRNGLAACYIQVADITLSGEWDPIGRRKDGMCFTGDYDGADFSISGLYITQNPAESSEQYGRALFNCLGDGSSYDLSPTLKNIRLTDVYIDQQLCQQVAALVGYIDNGTVKNCHSAGVVEGGSYTGGLIGVAGSVICDVSQSSSSCDVACSTIENVTIGFIGGFCASFQNGTMDQCYATGNVSGMGSNTRSIMNVGAFTGAVTNPNADVGKMTDCYARGQVNIVQTSTGGIYDIGGFAGYIYNPGSLNYGVFNCYSTGLVEASGTSVQPTRIGGFCGRKVSDATCIESCYYDSETSGQSDTEKGTPLTTAEMQLLSSYLDWDFDTVWNIDAGGYPYLRWSKIAYPLQTGKDYVYVIPFVGGTMNFGGKEYKFVDYLERFEKEQHLVAGVSRAYEYGGPLVKYGEQTYGFLASGITDPAAEGGFGTYLPDTKRTVLSLADRENFVNFYYIYPALPQVEKPVWVKKVITWKDVPGATAYEVKLFLDTEEQCIDTQLVGPGVQRFDFTYFIDLFMPAGSYHCTVQALAAEVTRKAIVWVDTPGATSYTVNLYNSDGEIVYTDSVAPGVQTYDFTAIIPTLPTGTNYYGVAIPVIPA